MFARFLKYSACLFAINFCAGCGSSKFASVEGHLVYPDGSPVTELKDARITFEATASDGKNYTSLGIIDANGKFVLMTEKPGDGAPIGKNRILIERVWYDPEHPAPRVIDAKYENFDTSGLEVEVQSGKNEFKLTVEPIAKGTK